MAIKCYLTIFYFFLVFISPALLAQSNQQETRKAAYIFIQEGKEGILDEKGKVLVPAHYRSILFIQNGLIPAVENDYFVFIKSSGDIIEGKFYDISNISNGLAAVMTYKERKWGYISTEGILVIPPRFEEASPFEEGGTAVVKEKGKFGYINKSGDYIVPPRFEDALSFRKDGIAAVKENGRWGYISRSGEYIIPPRFEDIHLCGLGEMSAVKEKGKWGYIVPPSSTYVIPAQYDKVPSCFFDKCVTVEKEGTPIAIDRTGRVLEHPCKVLLENKREEENSFSPDLRSIPRYLLPGHGSRVFLHWRGRFALATPDGKPLTKPSFIDIERDNALTEEDEFPAPVKWEINYKWGFIDEKGIVVVPFEYDAYCPFVGKVAKVLKGDKAFLIDTKGKIILDITPFRQNEDPECSDPDNNNLECSSITFFSAFIPSSCASSCNFFRPWDPWYWGSSLCFLLYSASAISCASAASGER